MKIGFGLEGVATDHQLASLAALEILRRGGNAFDAALAASAVLSVVQPHSSGLGGDGFLLAKLSSDEIIVYNGSGRSLKKFSADDYLREKPVRGLLTITVPGLVDLWGYVYENYASLDLVEILRPAISLASNGFYVGVSLARAIENIERELSGGVRREYENWYKLYANTRSGDLHVNKELSSVLRRIATRGWDEFYYGSIGEDIVSELQKIGLDIGLDDLMEHRGYVDKPLVLDLGDKTLYEIPPNSQGISTLQMIDALYRESLHKYGFEDPQRIISWLKPIEKIYYFRDNYLGDIDYMSINPHEYTSYEKIPDTPQDLSINTARGGGDTTFFVTGDRYGNLVGFIQSLFYPFGSLVVAKGIVFQNRGAGFSYRRDVPNAPAPSKRVLHTLSILLVRDHGSGKDHIIGCAGGHWRPQIHTRIYENLFIYSMSLEKAVSAPRFIYDYEYEGRQNPSRALIIENYLKPPERIDLEIRYMKSLGGTGLVNVLIRDNRRGVIEVASDPRSEGVALASN